MKNFKTRSIGIILGESLLKNHLSYYNELIDCFASYDITIYGDPWFKDKIIGVNFVVFNRSESFFIYLLKNIRKINQLDCLIIDENIGNPYFFYFFLKFVKIKIFFTVHNVNHWFLHRIKLRNIHAIFLRNLIINCFDSYIVVSPNLKIYLISILGSSKNVFFIPFASSRVNKFEKNKYELEETIFTIPGKVDEDRRNYEIVFSSFYNALKENSKITLVLLGELDADSVLYSRVQNINKEFSNAIIFFEDYISDNLYNYYLSKTDYIVANINQFKTDDVFMEMYGTSKESGFLFLSLQYGLKVLAPYYYIFPESLNDISFSYYTENQLSNYFVELKKKKQILHQNDYQNLVNDERNYLLNAVI